MWVQMLVPLLLIAAGVWWYLDFSSRGELGFIPGLLIFALCLFAAFAFSLGVIACGLSC